MYSLKNEAKEFSKLKVFMKCHKFTFMPSFIQSQTLLLSDRKADVNGRKRFQSLMRSPKGIVTYNAKQMLIRQSIINKIIEVIKLFGAVEIETPFLELTEYMTKKGGLDITSLYSLKDQGGEMLSLRHNLTIPFARYVANHAIGKMRCYQVGRVCRRDDDFIAKGCLRDFYQIDFNVAGSFNQMVPDSECIHILHKVLTELDFRNFILKVNHTKLLGGILKQCGLPTEKFLHIVPLLSKLRDVGWEEVRKIMIEQRVMEKVIDKIGYFMEMSGGEELISKLEANPNLSKSAEVQMGLMDLRLLFEYLKYFGCTSNLVLDVGFSQKTSIYTGVMFEALLAKDGSTDGWSIAGGGRFDQLIGQFDPRRRNVPCVGVSFDIDKFLSQKCTKQNFHANMDVESSQGEFFTHLTPHSSEVHSQSAIILDSMNKSLTVGPKTPKGTRDFHPSETSTRRAILDAIIGLFQEHRAQEIYTPAFEFKDILTGNYGEDEKLIYDIEECDMEALSLKYDLTVPFARFIAKHDIDNVICYQIDTVHRRDQPAVARGRFREFYQCDFDIAGHYPDPMLPDAECLQLMHQVLNKLDLGPFIIKVNHRKLLNGIFTVCGVPPEKFRLVSSSVDKLDKMSWQDVWKEIVEEKGLDGSMADAIGNYVKMRGGEELLYQLKENQALIHCQDAQEGLKELLLLSRLNQRLECDSSVVYDVGLARGMDYYTGVIFEAVLSDPGISLIGSVAAGGRYDNLVQMFHPTRRCVPCVGVSFGIERLFALSQQGRKDEQRILNSQCSVLVASPNRGLMSEVLGIVAHLRNERISAETIYRTKLRLLNQLQYAEVNHIPLVVVVGKSEVEEGVVNLRHTESRTEVVVKREDLATTIRQILPLYFT